MPGNTPDRFAGLPDSVVQNASNADSLPDVVRVSFTLPKSLTGGRWRMEEKFLRFTFEELTPEMQHKAAKIAKDNSSILQQELMFNAIVMVGDRPTKSDRDFLETWWRAIGPRCRMMVTTAFGELVSVDEADTAAFLGSRKDEIS